MPSGPVQKEPSFKKLYIHGSHYSEASVIASLFSLMQKFLLKLA